MLRKVVKVMTEFTGSILELNKKKALVMTDACDFVYIQRQPEMIVGQQIKFNKSEITKANKNYVRYLALVASVFIIALCSVFYMQIFVPNTVFAYIDIDINPSMEFVINKNAMVLDMKPLNKNAQTLLKELKLVELPLKEAIAEVVETSKQLGFISTNKNNVVLISASIDTDKNNSQNDSNQKTLDKILSNIGNVTFDVGTENIKPEILKVTPENRKTAIKNDISMGRYALYSKIKEDNKDITVEKAKTERVSDMLDEAKAKAKTKNKNFNKNKSSDSKDSKTNKKDSDDNHIDKSSENPSYNSNNYFSDNKRVTQNSKFNMDFTRNRINNKGSVRNFPKDQNTTQEDKNDNKTKNNDTNKERLERKNNIYNTSTVTDKSKGRNFKNRNNTKNKSPDKNDKTNRNDKDKNNKSNKK